MNPLDATLLTLAQFCLTFAAVLILMLGWKVICAFIAWRNEPACRIRRIQRRQKRERDRNAQAALRDVLTRRQ